MLLLIDNYDSFVHNLARYFIRLGCDIRVVRNDATSIDEVRQLQPEAIILSPGPCTPSEAGCSVDLVRQLHDLFPILGVCLGHQTIVAALGGRIVRCEPMHGRVSSMHHDQQGIFEGIPNPFLACRYHSLAAERSALPDTLQLTAETDDGLVMAVRHRVFPVVGLQFHPEAVLTEHGYALLGNFLRGARIPHHDLPPTPDSELLTPVEQEVIVPRRPVTF